MRGKPWKVVEDIDVAKVWLADRIADSDWPIIILVQLIYTEDYSREWAANGKYVLQIEAVAPDAPDAEHTMRVIDSIGSTLPDWNKMGDVAQALALSDYGTKAVLWSEQGSSLRKLVRKARSELTTIGILFGFYMDRAQNAIGNTGWDWIKGEIGFKRAATPVTE